MLHHFQQSQNPSKCCLISFKTLDCTVWMIMKLIFVSSTFVTRFHSTPTFAWLEWPSTHQCTIQKIPFWDFMDGMKLSPRGQYFFFPSGPFFPRYIFSPSSVFFLWGQFFYHLFFWPTPDPKFFLGSSYLPPTYLPTHLPPSSCWPLPTHLILCSPPSPKLGRTSVVQSFKAHVRMWRCKGRRA
jgi:hypothetical protein